MTIQGVALVVGSAARPAASISAPSVDTRAPAGAVATNPNVASTLAEAEQHRPDMVDISPAGTELVRLLYGVGSESIAARLIGPDGTIDLAALQHYLDQQNLVPLVLNFDHVQLSEEGLALAAAA